MHIGVLLFFRYYTLPLLLVAGLLIFKNTDASASGMLSSVVGDQVDAPMEDMMGSLMGGASATKNYFMGSGIVPIATSKWSSGRTLSGGAWIKP
jgi:hypothetical protein